jgi:hypothetical protein
VPIRAHIQYARPTRGMFDRADVQAAAAEGNAVAVEYWHEFFEPLHFQEDASRRYGYAPRAGSGEPPFIRVGKPGSMGAQRLRPNPHYLWRKLREKGHTRPLVWSGASERAARQIRITATARQGVGVMYALPKYFYAYRKDLKQPDKAAELTTVLDAEAQAMGRAAEGAMADVLNGAPRRPTRAA